MSQTYNLGKVAITPRGAYSSTAQYTPLDILSYNGSSYLVLQNCMGVTPPNATYYMVVASKGDTGSSGASPTIAAGTVTMTPAGTSASVTNVGTNVNASFNFTLPNGNVIYTGTGITGTSTTPTVFSGSGVSNAGVGDIYFNTSTVAFYRCALGGNASTAKWVFLTYAVPDGSVSTAKIADDSVTQDKIADDAVGNDQIADGAISASKLGSDVTAVLDNKANVDGAYEQMTVGNAEQLVSTVGITDNAPYNFRTSGGSVDIGDRETDMVIGGTVAWNQLMATPFAEITASGNKALTSGVRITKGHKYLMVVEQSGNTGNPSVSVRCAIGGSRQTAFLMLFDTSTKRTSGIYEAEYSGVSNGTNNANEGNAMYYAGVSEGSVTNIQLYDLTVMFGSTIADYIYTLEQNTTGAGVAWFTQLFPKPYYAFDAGELMSVNANAHKTVGFNAYDNTTGKAKVVGGKIYQITGTYTSISLSGTSITPDASGYFTPSISGELTVTGGNGTTTCVHLKWDGERDGEWEAYSEHIYALDSDLELRGIPQLDASNDLYYDGDVYASDGTVTRKYGIVDLGTLTWTKSTTAFMNFASTGINDLVKKPDTTNDGYKIVRCGKYASKAPFSTGDNYIYITAAGQIRIKDTSNASLTVNEFKTAMSGVYLVYELDTPTTESADQYSNPQIVDDWGTEEYVDYGYYTGTRDVSIPVGHTTLYSANLRAKLEMSPNSPNGDGLYALRQTGGINTYEEIIFPTELPSAPTSDGTYRLVCTVADGVATYSWTAN